MAKGGQIGIGKGERRQIDRGPVRRPLDLVPSWHQAIRPRGKVGLSPLQFDQKLPEGFFAFPQDNIVGCPRPRENGA